MAVWRITRRAGAWPRWLLIEDVEADDLAVENGGRQLTLYRDVVVILSARRVVVRRMDVRDVVEVVELRSQRSLARYQMLETQEIEKLSTLGGLFFASWLACLFVKGF